MTIIVSEIYQALKAAGIDEELARAAAKSVIAIEDKELFATKADLVRMKSEIIMWNVSMMITMTGIFAAIVRWMRP